MQLEVDINIICDNGRKYNLQRDSPVIIFNASGLKVCEGYVGGVSFAQPPFQHKIGALEIYETYNIFKRILYSVSMDHVVKVEEKEGVLNIHVNCFSRVC